MKLQYYKNNTKKLRWLRIKRAVFQIVDSLITLFTFGDAGWDGVPIANHQLCDELAKQYKKGDPGGIDPEVWNKWKEATKDLVGWDV